MTSLGKRLIQAAREASAIAKGEADPATYRVHGGQDAVGPQLSADDAYWAERMKPSRQQNLTPGQRKSRADALRRLRTGIGVSRHQDP